MVAFRLMAHAHCRNCAAENTELQKESVTTLLTNTRGKETTQAVPKKASFLFISFFALRRHQHKRKRGWLPHSKNKEKRLEKYW